MTAALLIGVVTAALGVATAAPANAGSPPFKMVNYLTGKCLEVDHRDNYFVNGVRVIEETCNGEPEQLWSSEGVGGGWFRLVNQRSFKCMDVVDGWEFDAGGVQQWDCRNTRGMNWKARTVDPFGGGKAVIPQVNTDNERCLDSWHIRNREHGAVITWHCSSNNAAQTYLFQ